MWFVHSALRAVFDLKRTCRHCGRSQLVALKNRCKTVRCNRCGKPLPPPRDQV